VPTMTTSTPTYTHHKLSAIHMGRRRYAVRPAGKLGTCGFLPAEPGGNAVAWQVVYVTARSPVHACAVARDRVFG
jgi:hypothetical protein